MSTCVTCASIGAEIHREGESPPQIPERAALELVTDAIWRCSSCGTLFRYDDGFTGSSEDDDVVYHARLHRLGEEAAQQAMRALVEQQQISFDHARRLKFPIANDVAGETTPLATQEPTWLVLPAIKEPAVALDPEHDALFVANGDGHRERRSIATGEVAWATTAAPLPYIQVSVSPQGTWLAVLGSTYTLTLYDAATGLARDVALPPQKVVNYLAPPSWIGDSLLVIRVSAWTSDDVVVVIDATAATVLWHTSGKSLFKTLGSPDGALLALWTLGDAVKIVDARTGAARLTLPSRQAFAWSTDCATMFLAGYAVVHAIDLLGNRVRWEDDCDYTSDAAIQVSPDGALVAFRIGNCGVCVRDATTGQVRWRRKIVHAKKLIDFRWTADSALLVTAGEDHGGASLRAWDCEGRWASAVSLPAAPQLDRRGDLAFTSPLGGRLPIVSFPQVRSASAQ